MTPHPPDAAADEELADLGELAGPLAHEFNNLLNNLGLHLTVLESDLPPLATVEFVEIRRQMARVTRLVQHYQQMRRQRPNFSRSIDLKELLSAVAAMVAGEADDPDRSGPTAAVRLDLPEGLPRVWSAVADLRRLCLFLVRNATRHAARQGAEVRITAETIDGKLRLRIEDPGPPLTDEQLLQIFGPYGDGRDGTNGLELAACISLARRLRGKVTAEHRPGGGAIFVLDLPAE